MKEMPLAVQSENFPSRVAGVQPEPWEEASKEPNSKVLFITCSDLPVTPHLLLRCGPGEVFMLQNAGNLVPPYQAGSSGEAATIEYCMRVLNVQHIIVCGHSHCGVLACLMNPKDMEQLPALKNWLSQAHATRTFIQKEFNQLKGESLVAKAIGENVRVQLQNLRTHPTVVERISLGQVKLHGWIYHNESGDLWFYDFESQRFLPLANFPSP